MKVCLVTRRLDAESAALRGWQRALGADVRSMAATRQLAASAAFPYDLVLMAGSVENAEGVAPLCDALDGHDVVLALWLEALPEGERLEAFGRALRRADVLLASQFSLCHELRAKLHVDAVELAAPWLAQAPQAYLQGGPRRRAQFRPTLAVVGDEIRSHGAMWRALGGAAYLWSVLRYRIVFCRTNEAAEEIAEHELVWLTEPLMDGGALAAHCAERGALLLSPRSYHSARFTFPYTTYEPGRARALFFSLHASPALVECFREHAAHRARQLGDGDRRLQLARAVQQQVPRFQWQPDPARPSLLEQIRHVAGPLDFRYEEDECALVCLVRNGGEYITAFLEHYRGLGVRHFVFVDNDSDDGSRALLEAQPDTTVYQTSLPHKHYECELRRLIIERHCQRRWCLNVDIDELFDYPESERLSLAELLGYLRRQRATAMVGYLLDMFAHENVFGEPRAVDLKSEYPFYDTSDIKKVDYFAPGIASFCDQNALSNPAIGSYFGGIRRRLFGEKEWAAFLLTKHPLIFLDGVLQPCVHPHFSNRARIADVTSVLYHYKFTPSFKAKVSESVANGRYVEFAQRQYDEYHRRIGARGALVINTPGRKRLAGVEPLVAEGFLHSSHGYRDYVEQRALARSARAWTRSKEAAGAHG